MPGNGSFRYLNLFAAESSHAQCVKPGVGLTAWLHHRNLRSRGMGVTAIVTPVELSATPTSNTSPPSAATVIVLRHVRQAIPYGMEP